MSDVLPDVPKAYHGLWERTLLERHSEGSLTSDRPAKVFWLQTPLWHADLRVPLERPSFAGVESLADCSDAQLVFLAGQEGFCGLTRIEGTVCTWLRLFDLNPGSALDIGHMRFERPDFLIETGIAEVYLEHWSLAEASRPHNTPPLYLGNNGEILLVCGDYGMLVKPRAPAPETFDFYQSIELHTRAHLMWRASLEISLCSRNVEGWKVLLSTHPWCEGATHNADKFSITSSLITEDEP